MSYSASRGFNPRLLFSWFRSEVAEGYRPRTSGPQYDPWSGGDPLFLSAWAGAPVVVPL